MLTILKNWEGSRWFVKKYTAYTVAAMMRENLQPKVDTGIAKQRSIERFYLGLKLRGFSTEQQTATPPFFL